MERITVEKSHITGIGYDRDSRTLEVTFGGERSYTYALVDEATFDGFVAAESKGKFFNENIKGKYIPKPEDSQQ